MRQRWPRDTPYIPLFLFKHFCFENDAYRQCSVAARAIWPHLMCLMAEGNPAGYVTDSMGGLPDRIVANFCNVDLRTYRRSIKELMAAGIAEKRADGTLFSSTVIRHLRICKNRVRRFIPLSVRRDVKSIGFCAFCNATEDLTVDHIVAYSLGGTDDRHNLQCLCRPCNSSKGIH